MNPVAQKLGELGLPQPLADLARRDVRPPQGQSHAAGGLSAVGPWLGHVVGVIGEGMGQDLAIDLRPARLGVVQVFQDEHGRAFGHDEAVALFVERAGGVPGIVVALAHGADDGERAVAERGQGGFGAADRQAGIGRGVRDGELLRIDIRDFAARTITREAQQPGAK